MPVVDTRGIKRRRSGELDKAFAEIRGGIWVLAIFSFAINLLLLASPFYMLQVYDRVLVSGRIETLIMLTLLVGGALLCLGLLDTMRSNLMVRMGGWLNARLGPMLLSTSVRAKLMGDTSGGQSLRDLSQVQGFVASQGLTMFLDAPWSPIFLLLIWMLHPLLGMLAVAATVVLLGLSLLNELLTRNLTLSASSAGIATQMHADTAIPQRRGSARHGHAAGADRALELRQPGVARCHAAGGGTRRAGGRHLQVHAVFRAIGDPRHGRAICCWRAKSRAAP